MKKVFIINAIFLLMIAACSDNNNDEAPYFNPVEGTWEREWINAQEEECREVSTFTKDFTSTSIVYYPSRSQTSNFTYTIDKTTITFKREDDRTFITSYSVNENTLMIVEGSTTSTYNKIP